ncbi:LOW QUALITY PROTEIN: hypothetical protein Cgig2_024981 [Carnegiea gigantea]|uniref:Uncharacterized protein n=1 Tax=Carnegiea gigantea TaxID=171969 RepID=A0A9Q1JRL2_9CARY|nr:LOW QUALITY PROTEIN: hypothetical protein Cgig2_024981 [Carnegiea gigantea]
MYHKAFITRMSIHSLSSMLNEAQTTAIRSIRFASFLEFSKWLVDSFDHYFTSFMLLDGQRFVVTTFDAYMTLGVPIGGREIMDSSRSSMDEEYDEMHAAWVKERKIEHTAPELTRMLEFILAKKDGGERFKRYFMIYLVNCFFSRPKNCYCSKTILKYFKDVD